jgi:predicted nucleic acid-binding protein
LNYLVDTNVLSELSKKHPNSQVAAFLNTLPKNGIFISVITPGEIIKGIEKAKDEAIKKRFSAWYEKVCLWFEGKTGRAHINLCRRRCSLGFRNKG